jgi:predicted Fe-Mo cluster-binding NifX family protein
MLAIPVLRSRVAPVFNWCSKIRIFSGDAPNSMRFCEEIELGSLAALSRLDVLRKRGVKTLICGALSPDLLAYGEQLGLRIIPGIAGEIDEVLKAFGSRELDQPRFWMPGCMGPRRYRGRRGPFDSPCEAPCSSFGTVRLSGLDNPQGSGPGARGDKEPGGGPGGMCICPQCGKILPHRRGIPCTELLCPSCRHTLVRK